MKKSFLYIVSFFAFMVAQAQTTSVFSFQPVSMQRIHTTDSAQLFATLISSTPGTPTITWIQTAGSPVIISPVINLLASWTSGAVVTGSFWVSNLPAGQYIWKATGLSAGGTTGAVYDTLNVVAAPLPRTVTGIIVSLFGAVLPIPAGQGTKVSLSDGTTQSY